MNCKAHIHMTGGNLGEGTACIFCELNTYKRLLDEQVDATNVVTKELNACYAELGLFRHPSEPDRRPDAIKRLRAKEGQ